MTHAYNLSPQETEGIQSCVARPVSTRKSMYVLIACECSKPGVVPRVPLLWRLVRRIAWVQKLGQLGWHSKSPSQRQKTKGQWDGSESPGTCCQPWRTEFEGGNHMFRRKWIPTNCSLLHTHNGPHMPTINIFIPSNTNISINSNKLPTYIWGAEWKDNYRIELRKKKNEEAETHEYCTFPETRKSVTVPASAGHRWS